ncbi:hypothetical protein [Alkalicoccobacillus porphyridii]|uniref:Uncharacterized protein n=1 Tax=Alkalicoccobacillus porphyridii TaxID=2597270 RepID=A0A553ZUD2_9BACI|nr:hypothetical protein [Alkalicoccobacillus porphyridii]TSB44935.1 hypothetical protein FN960_19000 [Alkalicoccobacillus porphyridii]
MSLLLVMYPTPLKANMAPEPRSQVIILVPGMSFEETEWYGYHGESTLWNQAYIGAMNTKSADLHSDVSSMVTLATGRKSVSMSNWQSFQETELVNGVKAIDLHKQLTGQQSSESIVHPRVAELQRKNQQTLYRSDVGQFGERLEAGNIDRYVMGTSDTASQHRFAGILAMNSHGTVNGDIINSLVEDTTRPYSKRVNASWMLKKLNQTTDSNRFMVIEWGDLYRLFSQKEQMAEEHYANQRVMILEELEAFIIQLREQINDDIWLISPFVHQEAYQEKQQLAPVYNWTTEGSGGQLYSETTKRKDVLSNIDIVPTFIKRLGLPSEQHDLGFALERTEDTSSNRSLEAVKNVNQMVGIFQSRSFVLSTYISCLALLLIVTGCFTWFRPKRALHTAFVLRSILLSALSSPLWLLVLAGLETKTGAVWFLCLLFLSSTLWGILLSKAGDVGIYITALLTLAVITLDVMTGSTVMSHSYLGYDPLIGARYYGIGNEYVGVFIIFGLLLSAWTTRVPMSRVSHLLFFILWLGQLVILSHPHLAANAGGFLSAVMTIGYWLLLECKSRMSRRSVILTFCITGAIAILLLFLMQQIGPGFSHIGKAYERLIQGDITFIFDTILRKLEMNLKLFKHSNWTQLLVTSYVLAAMILWWKKLPFREIGKKRFIKVGTVSSIFLLLINDSGVVAAAISMFCVVATYFYWIQTEREKQ